MSENKLLKRIFWLSCVAFITSFVVLRFWIGDSEGLDGLFLMIFYGAILLPPLFFPATVSGLLLASNIIASKIFKIPDKTPINTKWIKVVLLTSFLFGLAVSFVDIRTFTRSTQGDIKRSGGEIFVWDTKQGIDKCGDMPLNAFDHPGKEHFTIQGNLVWIPDCSGLIYDVFVSGTGWVEDWGEVETPKEEIDNNGGIWIYYPETDKHVRIFNENGAKIVKWLSTEKLLIKNLDTEEMVYDFSTQASNGFSNNSRKYYSSEYFTFYYPASWEKQKLNVFGSSSVTEFKYNYVYPLNLTLYGNYNQQTGKQHVDLDEYLGVRASFAIDTRVDNYPAKVISDPGGDHVLAYKEVVFFTPDKSFIVSLYYQPSFDTPNSGNNFDQLIKSIAFTSGMSSIYLKDSPLFANYESFEFSEFKSESVLVQDASYYGPPFDPDLYQFEISQSNYLFAKSKTVDLEAYLGKRVRANYREVVGIVMGEQQLVIVDSVEPLE